MMKTETPLLDEKADDTPGEPTAEHQPGVEVVEIDDHNPLEEEAPPEPAPEPIPEPAPPAPAKAPAPTRLQTHRKPDGTLDEERLENEILSAQEARSHDQFVRQRAQESPEFRFALLKEIAKTEKLNAANQAEFDRLSKPAVTEEQLATEYDKIAAAHSIGQANLWWNRNVTQPQLAAQRAEFEAREAARIQREQTAQAKIVTEQMHTKLSDEMKATATEFADIFVEDENAKFGYQVKDPAIREKMQEYLDTGSDKMTFKKALRCALDDLGRLGGKAPPAPERRQQRGIASTPVQTGTKQEYKPGVERVTIIDHGRN